MAIHLRLAEPRLGDVLVIFLRQHECRAERQEDGTVVVEAPHALHDKQARMELEVYLRLWQLRYGVRVEPVECGSGLSWES